MSAQTQDLELLLAYLERHFGRLSLPLGPPQLESAWCLPLLPASASRVLLCRGGISSCCATPKHNRVGSGGQGSADYWWPKTQEV